MWVINIRSNKAFVMLYFNKNGINVQCEVERRWSHFNTSTSRVLFNKNSQTVTLSKKSYKTLQDAHIEPTWKQPDYSSWVNTRSMIYYGNWSWMKDLIRLCWKADVSTHELSLFILSMLSNGFSGNWFTVCIHTRSFFYCRDSTDVPASEKFIWSQVI